MKQNRYVIFICALLLLFVSNPIVAAQKQTSQPSLFKRYATRLGLAAVYAGAFVGSEALIDYLGGKNVNKLDYLRLGTKLTFFLSGLNLERMLQRDGY